ncbi:MAG: hypothetical protein NC184_07875 [Roseburia sp.]|nr:hypothetical protein [Roseburia sp.]
MGEKNSSENEYRRKAEKERERKIADFEKLLLYDERGPSEPDIGSAESAATAAERADSRYYSAFDYGNRRNATELFSAVSSRVREDGSDGAAKDVSVKAVRAKTRAANIHGGHRQRMRESAKRDAELDSFSDVELLEMLLAYFVPRKDTNPVAHALLDKFGTLLAVFRAPKDELYKIPSITHRAADLISMLSAVYMWDGGCEITIGDHADAANFFESVFLGGGSGIHAAYLDGRFGLIAVEKTKGKNAFDVRAVVGSVYKYSAKYVVMSALGSELVAQSFNLIEKVKKLAEALSYVDAKLLDFMVFHRYGYFTLGMSALDGANAPEFLFVPQQAFARSPELSAKLNAEGIYADDE